MKLRRRTKGSVCVGLSGGVDSAVSAYLLQRAGYDVSGVFIKTWYPQWLEGRCTWREDRRDAMRVAAHLQIPFFELDLSRQYKDEVADVMIAEYRAGRTPNPDVLCNQSVKFGGFLDFRAQQGVDYVATGHYVRRTTYKDAPILAKGKDAKKDQSYFLYTLTSSKIRHALFPVGDLEKKDVRVLAKKAGLPVAQKKDSQGICFLGAIDIREFLSHYIDVEPGDVVDTAGAVVGQHEGALLYTLGQRHGFVLHDSDTQRKPRYVVAKDIHKNILVVSDQAPHERTPQTSTECRYTLRDVVLHEEFEGVRDLTCQIRYRGATYACFVSSYTKQKKQLEIVIQDIVEPVASGQSIVVYSDMYCVGGGIVV